MQKLIGLVIAVIISTSSLSHAHGGTILNGIEAAKHAYVVGHQAFIVEPEERNYSDLIMNAAVGIAHLKFMHTFWKQMKKGAAPDSWAIMTMAYGAIAFDLVTDFKTTVDYLKQDFSIWTAPIYLTGPTCFVYNVWAQLSHGHKKHS